MGACALRRIVSQRARQCKPAGTGLDLCLCNMLECGGILQKKPRSTWGEASGGSLDDADYRDVGGHLMQVLSAKA